VVGGGDFKRPENGSLKACFEITFESTPLKTHSKKHMSYPRHGHSVCALRDEFLCVTGSRVEKDDAPKQVEFYNIAMDCWFEQPAMNHGRYYHSSCVFGGKWLYVFAGIDVTTKRYFNSIERLDFSSYSSDQQNKWEELPNFD